MPSPPGSSEAELVLRAQGGDSSALRTLFDRNVEDLRARVTARLPALARGKVSASDVVQEAFLTAYQRLAEFRSGTSEGFRRWLFRIVDFKVREEARRWVHTGKRAAGREVRLTSGSGGVDAQSLARSPGTAAGAVEQRAEVLRALERLDAEDRAILDLVHRRDMTFPEAAACLGITAEAARKRHGRALARLGGLLRDRVGR